MSTTVQEAVSEDSSNIHDIKNGITTNGINTSPCQGMDSNGNVIERQSTSSTQKQQQSSKSTTMTSPVEAAGDCYNSNEDNNNNSSSNNNTNNKDRKEEKKRGGCKVKVDYDVLGGSDERGMRLIRPTKDDKEVVELLHQIEDVFKLREVKAILDARIPTDRNRSARMIQTNRYEIFLGSDYDDSEHEQEDGANDVDDDQNNMNNHFKTTTRTSRSKKSSDIFDSIIAEYDLPKNCKEIMIEYATNKSNQDDRLYEGQYKSYKYGNFSIIVTYDGKIKAQTPHIDLLRPNFQFGMMITDQSPGTLVFDDSSTTTTAAAVNKNNNNNNNHQACHKLGIRTVEAVETLWNDIWGGLEDEPPKVPSAIINALQCSRDVKKLINDFGDLLIPVDQLEKIQQNFSTLKAGSVLSLPGNVIHAGPDSRNFRAVLFYSAWPTESKEVAEYDPDTQYTGVALCGQIIQKLWRSANIQKDERLYLLRMLVRYMQSTLTAGTNTRSTASSSSSSSSNKLMKRNCAMHFNTGRFADLVETIENVIIRCLAYGVDPVQQLGNKFQEVAADDQFCPFNIDDFNIMSVDGLMITFENVLNDAIIYKRCSSDNKVILYYPALDDWEGCGSRDTYTLEMNNNGNESSNRKFNGSNGTLRETTGEEIECYLGSTIEALGSTETGMRLIRPCIPDDNKTIELLNRIDQVLRKRTVKELLDQYIEAEDDNVDDAASPNNCLSGVRLVQSNRYELFVGRMKSPNGFYSTKAFDEIIKKFRLPSKSKEIIINYAIRQSCKDPRLLKNGRYNQSSFNFGNFTLIITYDDHVPSQCPHIDVLKPNFQFGLTITNDSPGTLLFDTQNQIVRVDAVEALWNSKEFSDVCDEGRLDDNNSADSANDTGNNNNNNNSIRRNPPVGKGMPKNIVKAMKRSDEMKQLIRNFGDTLIPHKTLQNIQQNLSCLKTGSILSLPGSVVHAGPECRGFRAVMFFSAWPATNISQDVPKYDPDTQYSGVYLVGQIVKKLWRKVNIGYTERYFLLRMLVRYIRDDFQILMTTNTFDDDYNHNQQKRRKHWPYFDEGKLADFVEAIETEIRKNASSGNGKFSEKRLEQKIQKAANNEELCDYDKSDFDEISVDGLITPYNKKKYRIVVYQRYADNKVILFYPGTNQWEGTKATDSYSLELDTNSDDKSSSNNKKEKNSSKKKKRRKKERELFNGTNGVLRTTEGEEIKCYQEGSGSNGSSKRAKTALDSNEKSKSKTKNNKKNKKKQRKA